MTPLTPRDTECSSPRFCLADVLSDHNRTLALLLAGDGTIADLNESMARRLGQPAAELMGTLLWPHLPEELRAAYQATVQQVLRTGRPTREDVQYHGRWYDRCLTPCRNEQGEVRPTSTPNRLTPRTFRQSALRCHWQAGRTFQTD